MTAATPPAIDQAVRKTIEEGRFGEIVAGLVFAVPEGYLTTAGRAFDLEMDEAASLLCRASMEAAMYTFLFVEPAIDSGDVTLMRLAGPGNKIGYGELCGRVSGTKVAGAKLLSDSERTTLQRISDHGNTVAHVIERFHRYARAGLVPSAKPADFPYPERDDVKKDILEAGPILTKLRGRVAQRIQAVVATSVRKSPA